MKFYISPERRQELERKLEKMFKYIEHKPEVKIGNAEQVVQEFIDDYGEDGYKNREVMSRRYESALNILTDAERNEYLRDGHITVQEPVDFSERREVEERRSTRHETREHDLESILHAEFFACDTASDGVPFTHFLHMDYGFVSVIRFSDNTLHIHCDAEILQDYFRDLYQEYECEMFDGFIRVDLNKKKTEDWKIELIKQQLNS